MTSSNKDSTATITAFRDYYNPHKYWNVALSKDMDESQAKKVHIKYIEDGMSLDQAHTVMISIPTISVNAEPIHNTVLTPYDLFVAILKDHHSIKIPFGLRYQIMEQVEGKKVYSGWLTMKENTSFAFKGENFVDGVYYIHLKIIYPTFPETWIKKIFERYTKVDSVHKQPAIDPASFDKFLNYVRNNYGSVAEDKMSRYLGSYVYPDWREIAAGGMLLYGPPGTGKTRLCEELAKQLNLPKLFWGPAADLNTKYVGDTEKKLDEIAQQARMHPDKLHVMFLDEIHTLASSQKKNESNDAPDHKKDSLTKLITMMSDPSVTNILYLGCTNYIERVDETLKRSRRMSPLLLAPLSEIQRRKKVEEMCNKMIQYKYWNNKQAEMVKELMEKYDRNFTVAQMIELESIFKSNRSKELTKSSLLSAIHDVSSTSYLTKWPNNSTFAIPDDIRNLSIVASEEHQLKIKLREEKSMIIKDELKKIFGFIRDHSIGRLQLFAPSSMFVSEQSDASSLPIFLERGLGYHHTDDVIGAIVAAAKVDHVSIINSNFRAEHGESNMNKALESTLDLARSYEGNALIIVEVDEVAGWVPTSYSISKNYSSQVSVSYQESSVQSTSQNFSKTFGESTGDTDTIALAVSINDTTNIGVGLSNTESVSKSIAESINKNKSFIPFGKTKNKTTTETKSEGSSKGVSINIGKSKSLGNTQSNAKAHSVTNSMSDSVGTSKQESIGKNHGLTNSSSIGFSTNLQIQATYPKALDAVIQFARSINRNTHTTDPFVLFVYRVIEPEIGEDMAKRIQQYMFSKSKL